MAWTCSYGVVNCIVCKPLSNSDAKLTANDAAIVDKWHRYNSKVATNNRIYLNVPFAQKNAAKALGARWDADKKQWYADTAIADRFKRWIPTPPSPLKVTTKVAINKPLWTKPKLTVQPVTSEISFDELMAAINAANAASEASEVTKRVTVDRLNTRH